MFEREAVRQPEAEIRARSGMPELLAICEAVKQRTETGKIVLRSEESAFKQGKQAYVKGLLHPTDTDTALDGWLVFIQEIRSHSGRHRHQGGLAIYVLEGRGYTTVDGQRVDWEEGDLILLPVKPNGVEHQHFNLDPEKPSRWLALIPYHLWAYAGNCITQVELSPDWREMDD